MPDKFILHSEFQPTGDQPQAIDKLVRGIEDGDRAQTLLGVTGSGKTYHGECDSAAESPDTRACA
ncbi:MAG: hypothetical protein ACLTTQ_06155 [Christensenellales bacterium]